MNRKAIETILYSMGGVVAMAIILIAVNVLAGAFKERVDLTKEKAFTLSAGTRAILRKLDTPIKIRFYCTQSEPSAETVFLRNYAKHVEDLLAEYTQIAKGKLTIEKYDPQPDSDAEDSAKLDGIEGQMLRNGEKFYLGLAVVQLDQKQAIPFLDPNRERLLEYDLSRAITQVGTPDKPVVGIMSPLPVFGTPSNPMMARMGQQGGQQPWVIVNELRNDFNVQRVAMDVDKIDDNIKLLVVIHPRDITDKAQYAIDQFVMRGGKLIAFLDPLPMMDTREQNEMLGNMPNSGSSLDKLLRAWGLSFDTTKVVADMNFKMQLAGRNGQPQDAPAVMAVTDKGLNGEDIVTSQIDNVWLPYAGAFTGTPVQGIKETVLLKSTKDSQLVDGFMAHLSGENVMKDFKPSGMEYALAVRLTGKFKTAFPAGQPEEKKADETKDGDKKDTDKKTDEKKADDSLKETSKDNTVILVGDADMLYDRVALQPVNTLFGTAYTPANGNLSFAQNAIEQLTGDSNLIGVRSRATIARPFTRVKAMEAAANEKFQSEIKRLEDSASEAQRKINELQQQKTDKDQRFILSPEQTAELAKLRGDEADTRRHLKQVQKDLRKEVVSLQNTVKWVNILAVPIAVMASGLVIAFVKRKKTSAK